MLHEIQFHNGPSYYTPQSTIKFRVESPDQGENLYWLHFDTANGTIFKSKQTIQLEFRFDPKDPSPPRLSFSYPEPLNNVPILSTSLTVNGTSTALNEPPTHHVANNTYRGASFTANIPNANETHILDIGGHTPGFALRVTIKRK